MSNNSNSNGNHRIKAGEDVQHLVEPGEEDFLKNSSLARNATPAFSTSELGEVKIAVGRLYKEIESLKQSQKTERERDRAELQAWAQTNLIQNQLLSKAMATIEMLTLELKNQNLSCQESEQNNETLRQELTLLLTQLQNMPKSLPTLENLEFKGLKSEIQELKSNWDDLLNHTNKLTTAIQELKNTPTQKPAKEKEVIFAEPAGNGCIAALGTGFAFLLLFFLINQLIPVKISGDIQTSLQSILDRIGYTNVKLQRVEKRLRTDPNQK